jgi:hypothetical protein
LLPDYNPENQAVPVAPLDHWLARRLVRVTRYPQPFYRTESFRDPGRSSPYELPALEAGLFGKHS